MTEYIERANLIARIEYYVTHTTEGKGEHYAYSVVLNEVLNRPAADVAPVRHGRWIGCNGEIVDWDENNPGCPRHSCFCSICKSWLTASDEFPVIAYFCPNCGAKMDGGADND